MGTRLRAGECRTALIAALVLVCVGPLHTRERRQQTSPQASEISVLLELGRYQEAEDRAHADFESQQNPVGARKAAFADSADLLVLTRVLNGRGHQVETIRIAEQAVGIRESEPGTSVDKLAESLARLGSALSAAGQRDRAVATLRRAVSLAQGSDTGCALACARILDTLGIVLTRAGSYDEALPLLGRSLALKESGGNANERELAVTLQAIASATQWRGDYAAARAAIDRALRLQRDLAPHPVLVEGLSLLEEQLWFEGDLLGARDASVRAIELGEQTLRRDHPTLAYLYGRYANVLRDLGDLAQARSMQEREIAIIERNFGRYDLETALYLNGVAESQRLAGEYVQARSLYQRALQIGESRLGPIHDWNATFIHNLALVDARLGDYELAKREHARAMAIWEKVYGSDHAIIAVALTELAAVLREEGAASEALPLLQRALAIRERQLGPNHRDVAKTLTDLAATLAQLGRLQQAEDRAARAQTIWEGLNAPDAPEFASLLALRGDLKAAAHEEASAQSFYLQARAIREKVMGAAHPLVADVNVRLARSLAATGDIDGAIALSANAEAVAREHLRLTLRYLPERQALEYAANRPHGLDLIVEYAGYSPSAASVALDGLIRGRALVLDEMGARNRSLAEGTPAESPDSLVRLRRARQRLVNLVVRTPSATNSTQYAVLIESARLEADEIERDLASHAATSAGLSELEDVGLEQVSDALPASAALVAIVSYQPAAAGSDASRRAPTPGVPGVAPGREYKAFVLRHGGTPPSVVTLGPVVEIDRLISRWRRETRTGLLRRSGMSAETALRQIGVDLRRRIWDPLASHIVGVDRVFIVPDGPLSLVSFAALPTGPARYLIEDGPTIHYLSAERDLTVHRDSSAAGLLALGGASFGDPSLFSALATGRRSAPASLNEPPKQAASGPAAYRSATSRCATFQALTFGELPASAQEVASIAALWEKFVPAAPASGQNPSVLVGAAADERSFKVRGPGSRVLHLATHGFFLGTDCTATLDDSRSVGGLVPRSRPKVLKQNPNALRPSQPLRSISENPLLLSGLALAGANRRTSATGDEEDGILTAEEVASMNLVGVEWAVLSACDTGLGEIRAGEGVLGLRRAFQVAGAHTVIMSLWAVADRSAIDWMRALYEGRLARKLDTAAAVREASITVLHQRRAKGQSTHPFYWAGFVASGDWR